MTATAPETGAGQGASGPGPRPPGRRERKKQRTREALVDAAFDLFSAKGFDATTVEEIADAVDVSSRTFFRYFASKEDVALTFQEEQTRAIMAALAERPADEPIMTALRRAVVVIARACEAGELGFDPGRFQCMLSMMNDSPALMAGSLEHAQKKQTILIDFVAERLGVDPATDLRPHVIAGAATGAFQAAAETIRRHGDAFGSMSQTVDQAFALLEESLNYPQR
ncbi:TetR family transcriptional regulator [Actinomadura livida]|uniref:AcrR family transcriptional regulator n=1 Tax=Actinomadura livida TaxID=79909 RepID=A0A7W7IHY5_9ACTN|nr:MULTISPECIES: TetR family transcriptional regulator [Actinomadura]MBB4777063.1 AcrR family transcriptional regulator [Actinomadura catellatispora]GGU37057.1 TetR family transcriptional regulator [Actinomadura livida]